MVTGLLIVVTVAGITLVVINENIDALDTTFQIIAFSLGSVGLIMSVFSQIDGYAAEKDLAKALEEMRQIEKLATKEMQTDKTQQAEIKKIMDSQQRIYRRVSHLDRKKK